MNNDAAQNTDAGTKATEDANAVHIVLFGMPAAGKSSLLGALAQAAQAQEHLLNGRLKDLTHGLDELRHRLYDESPRRTAEEVVPYPVDYEPFNRDGRSVKEHLPAVVIDCDGRVANDLLVRRQAIADDSPEGTLAHEVSAADTLVLVIDAAAPPAQVETDFTEFDRFLRQMETSRGRRAEVGGLPVFLVLTKCDLLAQPTDTAAAWMERIEERKRDVDRRFRAFLARREQEAGPLPFGRIDLHLWATAVKRPALAGTPAKPREPFGVAELFRQCMDEAAQFRDRRRRAGRRLLWTVGGASGIVALLTALTVGQALRTGESPPTPLENELEQVLSPDGTTAAERLGYPEATLRRRLSRLEEIRDKPEFSALPSGKQKLVRDRVEELEKYLAYLAELHKVGPPAGAENERALQEMEDRLKTDPTLQHPEWKDTEAGKLHRNLLTDVQALRVAVNRVRNAYQEAIDRAVALWTFKGYASGPEEGGIDWQKWTQDVEKLLDPGYQPFAADARAIPGSATGLTYQDAEKFVKLRQDHDRERDRLRRLLNLTAALGLARAKGKPDLLVFRGDFTLEQVRARLQELARVYPDWEKQFRLEDLPDAVRPLIRNVARTNYENLLEPARAMVLRQLQQGGGAEETPQRWETVRGWLKDPEELAAWRVVAVVLARLNDPDAPDPVTALHSFLQKSSFSISISRIVVEIPESLKVKPGPDAAFAVYHPSSAGDRPALLLEQSGEGERRAADGVWVYSFRVVEGQRVVYKPGDPMWASLPLRDDWVLTWRRSRSAVYEFESLLRPPRLHRKDEPNTAGSLQKGVRVTITPADGVPRVPDLMPVVRLEK